MLDSNSENRHWAVARNWEGLTCYEGSLPGSMSHSQWQFEFISHLQTYNGWGSWHISFVGGHLHCHVGLLCFQCKWALGPSRIRTITLEFEVGLCIPLWCWSWGSLRSVGLRAPAQYEEKGISRKQWLQNAWFRKLPTVMVPGSN